MAMRATRNSYNQEKRGKGEVDPQRTIKIVFAPQLHRTCARGYSEKKAE